MPNEDIIKGVLQRVGQELIGQLNLSWDTRQTLEQYLEILEDNQDEFDFDEFMEYVYNNLIEDIMTSLQSESESLLETHTQIVDSNGRRLY